MIRIVHAEDAPDTGTLEDLQVDLEDMSSVILYNDEENFAEYVASCLMQVFDHPPPLAMKITLEAHTRGRALAEVEPDSEARKHCKQLQALGLTADVEKG